MKKVLVTGGCGFIGSNLVKRLVSLNYQVDVVDDFSSGHLTLLDGLNKRVVLPELFAYLEDLNYSRRAEDVYVFECDFAHEFILARIASKKYDLVFHQAAVPRVSYSVENPVETTDVNLLRSVALLKACAGNTQRVVMASSSSVYGGPETLPIVETTPTAPKSPYAMQKLHMEGYAKLFGSLYGLDSVCLRYFNVFGPGQYGDSPYSTAISAWCDAIVNNKTLRSDGDGTQSRDLCYIDNVVNANILAATSPNKFMGETFNVCCGERTSNNQILEALKEKYSNIEVKNAPWRAGDVMHTQGDWTKAKEALGYEPTVMFWDGFNKTLKWWGI